MGTYGRRQRFIHIFEFLKDWANTLPFEEIKVIRLMIQEPGQKILLHTDYDEHQIAKFVKENKHPPVKEAIYCSPFENKNSTFTTKNLIQNIMLKASLACGIWEIGTEQIQQNFLLGHL